MFFVFTDMVCVQGFGEDDYLLLDCPGQIELFTHIPVLRTLVDFMKNDGWNICAVYCLDSHFITDSSKFIAGCFQAMSAMVTLEVPHLNVLTKIDLMPDKVKLHTQKSGSCSVGSKLSLLCDCGSTSNLLTVTTVSGKVALTLLFCVHFDALRNTFGLGCNGMIICFRLSDD